MFCRHLRRWYHREFRRRYSGSSISSLRLHH
jgi:hypothetical protein